MPRTKRDKIFDNKFDEVEYDSQPINFKVDSGYESDAAVDDSIHDSILFEKVQDLIANSKFAEYAVYNGESEDRMGKSVINEIYLYISQRINEYTKQRSFLCCLII